MAKNRWSLTDLSKHVSDEERAFQIKRWNSLSNDELIKFREEKYFMEPLRYQRGKYLQGILRFLK